MKPKLNIVWLKRDLRLQDHRPLAEAENDKLDYIIIYIFEPSALRYPDSSLRHQQFVYHSIRDLNQQLKPYKREVFIFYAEAIAVFSYLLEFFNIQQLFSYQESGIRKTWERDKAVDILLKANNIQWNEYAKDGVLRGIKNRESWDAAWYKYMSQNSIINNYSNTILPDLENPFPIPKKLEDQLLTYPDLYQKPGEHFAWLYLKSFCDERGKNYSKHISKPLESRKSGGRISPHLAWGNISARQAYQFIKNHPNYTSNKRSFEGMLTRLKWRSHFIQKFEVECDYETRCVNRGYEDMQHTNDMRLIEAWKNGETGFPLVDACMRCLQHTGWINFRMRAMLVSVFCHHFDCDWRKGVYHLANLFLDYEPGIHFTQFQMQAGTTGVNLIRMYNPIKQSKDHDPNGIFIKQWVNELSDVPTEFIHEPWKMTALDKAFNGLTINYPNPIVNLEKTGKSAKEKIWRQRADALVKSESQRIIKTHTRNKRTRNNQKLKS
ncbi:MAG: deoxyribodipyrimidine photo-lyase [Bacteroidales bacterium]|jgi:deoxyribodipyrimidine photo-lyase|nr:deoxyribodipyrimidine photo-lyase [Bacteroidales bacterium]